MSSLKELAYPQCHQCQGRGRIYDQHGKPSECVCVYLKRRRQASREMLNRVLPLRAQRMTLNNFQTGGNAANQRALDVARNFVDNWPQAKDEGWNLGFYGHPRAGKTHLAVAIGREIALRYGHQQQLQLLNVPKALQTERETYNREGDEIPSALKLAEKVPLLILDDLGAEYDRAATETSRVSWLTEQLYVLLDARVMNNLPTIYTSNLTPSDMERRSNNEAWQRVYARLTESQQACLEIFPVPGLRIADPGAEELLFAERTGPELSDSEFVRSEQFRSLAPKSAG